MIAAWVTELFPHAVTGLIGCYLLWALKVVKFGDAFSGFADERRLMHPARSNGLALLPLGMVWAFAAGGKICVYQSGVVVAGYSYGYFSPKDLVRVGLCLTLVESLVLTLIVPFYWPLIGIH